MRMEVCFVHCKQVPMPQLIAHIDGYGPLTQRHDSPEAQRGLVSVQPAPPCIFCFRQYICNSCIDSLWITPRIYLGEKHQNHGFWCPVPLCPKFMLVDLIFLEGDCRQVLFKLEGNRSHYQCSQYLVDKSGTISLSRGHGTQPAFRQWKIKEITI